MKVLHRNQDGHTNDLMATPRSTRIMDSFKAQ
jgi:hypothetical protein